MNLLSDYSRFVAGATAAARAHGVKPHEIVQCDMINIECSTDKRYSVAKQELFKIATLLNEIEHNGRLISIHQADIPLTTEDWQIPYIELLQPKPTRANRDGIDSVFFVTNTAVEDFLTRHADVPFDTKGLTNRTNPYVELKTSEIAMKFHDRHMGAVLDIEQRFAESL